jgi:lipopolysaccharide assembly outer membrane protein LptD (OstA)
LKAGQQVFLQANKPGVLLMKGGLKLGFLLLPLLAWTEDIQFSALSMRSAVKNGGEVIILEGNAEIETGELLLRAFRIEISGAGHNNISASGNVSVSRRADSFTITCDSLILTGDRLTARNNVEVSNPQDKLSIRALFLEQEGREGHYIFKGAVRLMKETIFARADSAVYNKAADILLLTGRAETLQEGQTLKAEHIEVHMKNNAVTLRGAVKGSLTPAAQEEDAP